MYNSTVVQTTHGPVRGRTLDGVQTFLGIRYGADTAPTRFLPPRPPQPWTDVANAWAYGPSSPQDDPDHPSDRALDPFLQKIGLTDNQPESEDCLVANVWTPAADGAARPVMVWVHSGGFSSNSASSPTIDGAALARDGDVVVASFNHRLGVLGYTHLTSDPDSPFVDAGNAGMLDIVFFLEWVRDNIAAFGGDPASITVFGQSGGAMKISTLLGMPSAEGLFHRAILQSGAMPEVIPADAALKTSAELLAAVGLADGDFTGLQALPLADLMRAYKPLAARDGVAAFGSVADGRVVAGDPFGASPAVGWSSSIPTIIGDTETEATLFSFDLAPTLRTWTTADLVEALGRGGLDPETAAGVVDAVATRHPDEDTYEIAARVLSAGVFTVATDLLAERQAAAGAPVWRYRIAWRTPVDDGVFLAPHEIDVALVFGNVDGAVGLNGGGADARRLSDILHGAWLAFARTGSPATDLVPDWPAFDPESRATLVLDPEPTVQHDVDGDELRALRPLMPFGTNWFTLLR
jgi:para-nitrobenzyl esterase